MKPVALVLEFRKQLFALFLCALLVPFTPGAVAQDDAISQGRAAVLLANAMGLGADSSGPLTEDSAIRLLNAQGIAPLGGWDSDANLTSAELARFMVQALGADADFSQEQVNDPSAQAYKDLLIADFDVDVDKLEIDTGTSTQSQSGTVSQSEFQTVLASFNQAIITDSDGCNTDCPGF